MNKYGKSISIVIDPNYQGVSLRFNDDISDFDIRVTIFALFQYLVKNNEMDYKNYLCFNKDNALELFPKEEVDGFNEILHKHICKSNLVGEY